MRPRLPDPNQTERKRVRYTEGKEVFEYASVRTSVRTVPYSVVSCVRRQVYVFAVGGNQQQGEVVVCAL